MIAGPFIVNESTRVAQVKITSEDQLIPARNQKANAVTVIYIHTKRKVEKKKEGKSKKR